jgi:hypothetical protein
LQAKGRRKSSAWLQGQFIKSLVANIFYVANDLSAFFALLSTAFDLLPLIASSFAGSLMQLPSNVSDVHNLVLAHCCFFN